MKNGVNTNDFRYIEFSSTRFTIGITAQIVLPANKLRGHLAVQNQSLNAIHISYTTMATTDNEIIEAGEYLENFRVPANTISIIALQVSTKVIVTEGLWIYL